MPEVKLEVMHGIIFINNISTENITIPEYIPEKLVSATNTCISVATQAYVDGYVEIKLTNNFKNDSLNKVFQGMIETPDNEIGVFTSEDICILHINTLEDKTQINIWADDLMNPSKVVIETINTRS